MICYSICETNLNHCEGNKIKKIMIMILLFPKIPVTLRVRWVSGGRKCLATYGAFTTTV